MDIHLPESVGALSALSVVPGGYGGRNGLPSVLLGGALNGKLVAFPWPLDEAAYQKAVDLGEQGSVEPEDGADASSGGGVGTLSNLKIPSTSSVFDPPPVSRNSNAISLKNPLIVATHSGPVTALGVSPEGDCMVTAGRDGSLFVTMLRKSGTGNAVKLAGIRTTFFSVILILLKLSLFVLFLL